MKVKSALYFIYLSRQMQIILGCSLLISKNQSPKIIFSYACAGNFQGLETSEFCYILWNKKA